MLVSLVRISSGTEKQEEQWTLRADVMLELEILGERDPHRDKMLAKKEA